MAKNINSLSPDVIAELGEMKAYVDRMRRGGTPGPHEPGSRFREKQVRIARTTTGLSCSSYPQRPANTYVVELGKGAFDPSCGLNTHAFTPYAPPELRYAHTIEGGKYLEQGSTVLVMLIHDKWYIVPLSEGGTIAFTMLTDRTREQDAGGLSFGRAQATITDSIGTIGDSVGDTVEIIFVDKRWLEAVTLCEGRADYIDGKYIVTEVQGLVQGFWFVTLEARINGAPDQDVRVAPFQNIGHANDDLPIETQITQPQQGSVNCGSFEITWTPDAQDVNGGAWTISDISNFNSCCAHSWNGEPPPSDPTQQQTKTITGPFYPTGQCDPPPEQQTDLRVRYLAGTYPRMLAGAIGYCQLDNDIANEDDNSTMRYYVVQSDQMAKRIRAALTAPMCGSAATIAAFSILDFFPNGQLPVNVGTSVPNPKGHYGLAGDIIDAEWNETTEQWNVYDVTKHAKTLYTEITKVEEDGCTTITANRLTAAIELCSETVTPFEILKYRTQTVSNVSGVRFEDGSTGNGSGVQCDPKLIVDLTRYEGYVICEDPTVATEELSLDTELTTVDVYDNGQCIRQSQIQLVIFGTCGDYVDEDVVCTTDEQCESGSGSGS